LTTHHHNGLKGNVSYEYGYMYEICLDIAPGSKQVTLPDNNKIAVFAMTLSNNPLAKIAPATQTFIRP